MFRGLFALALGLLTLTTTVVHAEDILKEHKLAIGGTEAINKVKSFRRTAEVEVEGEVSAKGSAIEAAIIGEKCYQEFHLPGSDRTIVCEGEKAWMVNSMDSSSIVIEVDEAQLKFVKANASINPLVGIVALTDPATIKVGVDADFEGVKCKAYIIGDSTVYLGEHDHLFHGMTRTSPSDDPLSVTIVHSDFEEYEGVKFPNKIVEKLSSDAKLISTTTITYTKTEINPKLDESLFRSRN